MAIQNPTDVAMRTIELPQGSLRYSPKLVRTGADLYDTLKIAAERAVVAGNNSGPPTAGEEQNIYATSSANANRLSDVEELKDYFAKNAEHWYAWSWTLTGLRVPEEYVGREYAIGEKVPVQVIVTDITPYIIQIADPQFTRENWKDIIDKVNHVKGELAVPYTRGHVIREMHPTFGIFTEVEPTTEHKASYALHGWLRKNLAIPQDPISGHYDVAVGRRSGWRRDVGVRCLGVDAYCERWDAGSADGFRPVVRGSVPEN